MRGPGSNMKMFKRNVVISTLLVELGLLDLTRDALSIERFR